MSGDSIAADSTFGEFIVRNPTSPDGYLQRALVAMKIDREEYKAVPYYQKYIELTASDPAKYKRNLTDAYSYIGLYYFDKMKDKEQAKGYFVKALEVDPNNEMAAEMMKQYP
jgi:tetratricopeptide (TPR) repeat protein